jgi:hypothetical protein
VRLASVSKHQPPSSAQHRLGLVGLRRAEGWELHPGVRSADGRDRAADLARDVLGSWTFAAIAAALAVASVVMSVRRDHPASVAAVLSGLVLVELSIVLMTARRTDEVAGEVALYELESDRRSAAAVEDLRDEVERLRGDLARLTARLQTSARPVGETRQTREMGDE